MTAKRRRSKAEIRQDEYDGMIRRVLGLIAVYQEMLESFLRCDAFDEELVKRMIAIRETTLQLIESTMPVPIDAARAEEVETKSRAVH